MHRAQLEQYINNPESLDEKSIDGLWQLVKEYPYFSTGRLLLAKNLEMTGHEAYPLAFRLAAAYAGDRSLLKQLMEPVRYPVSANEKEQETEKHEETVITNSIEISVEEQEVYEEPIVETNEILEKVKLIDENTGHQEAEKDEKILSPMIDLIRQSLQKARDIEKGAEERKTVLPATSGNVKSSKRQELIDKFIKEEPRISAPKKEFFNPEDHARQSSIVHEDLVSETLAVIYVKQGLIGKAIKIYEKLILLIPEKSSYFAGRIEELRKEHK